MLKTMTTITLIALATINVFAQDPTPAPKHNFAEIRWSKDNLYGYGDYVNTKGTRVLEVFLVKTPGQTQGCAGIGKQFTLNKLGTISAMLYGVIGSNDQLGVMPAVLPTIEKGKYKSNAFLAWFIPIKGEVHQFLVLDTWDTTYALSKRFDAGTSIGFFLQDGKWNPQVGPVLKINDKLGSYSVSYRVGTGRELRFGRTFIF